VLLVTQHAAEIANDRIAWAQQAAATFTAIATCLIGPHLARRLAARQAVHLPATGFSDATLSALAYCPRPWEARPQAKADIGAG
jgi:hypothetical protein